MKFGSREICNVVFRAKNKMKIGNTVFEKNQPVLYIDTAKTSSMEGAATTVYAQGGRGNTRLIAWEGEKTLTYNVEDALLSPISFSMLSGAGLIKAEDKATQVHFHTTTNALVDEAEIDLTDALATDEKIDGTSPLFAIVTEDDGSITGEFIKGATVSEDGKKLTGDFSAYAGKAVMVDYYVLKKGSTVSELQIDAENFAGYFYVEADTLFRRQIDGKDLPANITFPNVKIQSNFTFNMASTGDPSTFSFVMDAFPGYTYFDKTKQVLCVIQILDDSSDTETVSHSVMLHESDAVDDGLFEDQVDSNKEGTTTDTGETTE